MLGVDTNVLVRFLAEDDDIQSPQAARLLTDPANQPVFVSTLVLSECYTVLTRVKKFPAAKVVAAFRMMISSDQFTIERPDLIAAAIDDAERVGCGLADAVIARQNALAGCRSTATFDIRAQRLDQMTAVEDALQ